MQFDVRTELGGTEVLSRNGTFPHDRVMVFLKYKLDHALRNIKTKFKEPWSQSRGAWGQSGPTTPFLERTFSTHTADSSVRSQRAVIALISKSSYQLVGAYSSFPLSCLFLSRVPPPGMLDTAGLRSAPAEDRNGTWRQKGNPGERWGIIGAYVTGRRFMGHRRVGT